MEEIYLVTGATGFLGSNVIKKLIENKKMVIGLRLPEDKANLLPEVKYCMGDITKLHTLTDFFGQTEGKDAIVIHCAGCISVKSKNDQLWKVNVDGTKNILDLCEKHSISKLIYVSSVHAIEERKRGEIIEETKHFSASSVRGDYAKSKAEATDCVMRAAQRGLPAVVVHPSGLIGPGDYSRGYMTEVIKAFLKGYFPCAIEGGYDFVDVRDVANGIIACAERGKIGETYILSNEYITIKRMFDTISDITGKRTVHGKIPRKIIQCIAPFCEKVGDIVGSSPLITPYAIYTLGSNGNFSHEKAVQDLGYSVRPIEETLADTIDWINKKL